MVAIDLLVPMLDKFPELKGVLNSSKGADIAWDFFMTVAGVGIYLLTHKVSEEEYKEILKELVEVYPKGKLGLENFMDFMERDKENEVDYQVRTGVWVLWNLKGGFPTSDETDRLAPAIGNLLERVVSKETGQ